MTYKTRIELAEAKQLAEEVIALYDGTMERVQIAGSIRRESMICGDAEIVFIPRFAPWGEDVLFESHAPAENLQRRRTDALIREGLLIPRLNKAGHRIGIGPSMQCVTYKGFNVDLFGVLPPSQWGIVLLIRTGPAAFSHKWVTTRRAGGYMPPFMHQREAQLWRHSFSGEAEAVEVPEEEDYFRILGVPYIEPKDRGFALVRNAPLR